MGWRDLIPWKGWTAKRPEGAEREGHRMLSLQQDMNRVFDDFQRSFLQLTPFDNPLPTTDLPRVDIEEGRKRIEVTVEVPGLSEEDIQLTLSRAGDVLHLRAERRQESEGEERDKGPYRIERYYGLMRRSIPLPHPVVMDGAKAKLKNGVLHVVLHKREETPEAKQIRVTRG